VAVLGCMAERLKHKLLEEENLVDIVAGPDSYRTLPKLLHAVRVEGASNAIDVQLSLEETYADIKPVRAKGISAYISIMRGCNNMCSFCVVPFTRGRERSRAVESIMKEVQDLETQGVREITLLGQNVNSYLDDTYDLYTPHTNSPGFSELYKLRDKSGARFADLLSMVAEAAPNTRIRFTSPHPKDFPDRVLEVIKEYPNICKQIHLPLQSGSSNVLQRMRRGYTHEAFIELADRIRRTIPGVALSTDVIAGFCGETEEDHEQTLRALEKVQFEQAFMFAYSMRGKTHAFNNYQDDVPQEVKLRRLGEIIDLVKTYQLKKNQAEIANTHTVLIEGPSKRDELIQTGRTDTNKRAVFVSKTDYSIGEYVKVKVSDCSSQTLYVEALD
jgi:MiaB/RimO family radical SAM methylthiotransferase